MSSRSSRLLRVFLLTTIGVAVISFAVGTRLNIISPCPQPPDWLPRPAAAGILLAFLGSPIIGGIATLVAARRNRP